MLRDYGLDNKLKRDRSFSSEGVVKGGGHGQRHRHQQ